MIPGPFPIDFILRSNVILRLQGTAPERRTLTFDMVINAVTTPFHMPDFTVAVIVPYRMYSVDDNRVPLGARSSCVKINASSEEVTQNLSYEYILSTYRHHYYWYSEASRRQRSIHTWSSFRRTMSH
jgi:hypothetical protein